MKPSGRIFYKDEFDQIYRVEWSTVGGVIDLTSTVEQPFVWGRTPQGYIRNGVLFRRGVVTITRQALRPFEGGYEVVAEGTSQFEDDIQMNFPCERGPTDPFTYHLNAPIVDGVDVTVTDGPRWADPDNLTESEMVWSPLDVDGSPAPIGGTTSLEFIDVWS